MDNSERRFILELRLNKVLEQLDVVIEKLEEKAARLDLSPYELRTKDGQYLMAQVSVAQAHALAALTTLTD